MALTKCADCGKEISDRAPACIHCGAPSEAIGGEAYPEGPIKAREGVGFNRFITRVYPNSAFGQSKKALELKVLGGLGFKVDSEVIEKGNYSGAEACFLFMICIPLVFFTKRGEGKIHVTLSRWFESEDDYNQAVSIFNNEIGKPYGGNSLSERTGPISLSEIRDELNRKLKNTERLIKAHYLKVVLFCLYISIMSFIEKFPYEFSLLAISAIVLVYLYPGSRGKIKDFLKNINGR